MIACRSEEELAKMRVSGRVTARALDELKRAVAPGATTKDVDALATELIRKQGGDPAFLGYQGFSGSICTSVNEEVVHGIPGKRKLRSGDLLKIDIGALVDGWYSDMACTIAVGQVSEQARKLMEVTEQALYAGIGKVRAGAHVSDIGYAVQSHVESHGFSVVRALVGHGIGTHLHEDPPVPNYGRAGMGPQLRPGMVLAIEPMVNAGSWRIITKDDRWTVVTADGRLSAHFEHTVAVTPTGYEILTVDRNSAMAVEGGEVGSTQARRAEALG